MKKNLRQLGPILGSLLLAAFASYGAQGAVTNTNTVVTEVMRKSVFEDNSKTGKDPFFPSSTRRVVESPSTEPLVAANVQLLLKGISGPANRRFALINNQPLGVGETAFVRISGGQIKVHCWEIRENSVIVTVEGNPEKKELKLREGL